MKISELIMFGWEKYIKKVSSGLIEPENEKMMQLQLSQIYQTLSPIYESENFESIKILLEVPVRIDNGIYRIIDIVILHTFNDQSLYYPIELKCFRLYTRKGKGDGKKRGAQNLGMYDYWEDIENIEGYVELDNYKRGYQFTITDDPYYVKTMHKGEQVAEYSTNEMRKDITGKLANPIASRLGEIVLKNTYSMEGWKQIGDYWFIEQIAESL